MTFRRALEILGDRQETRIRLGLGRMRRHLAALGDPQKAYRCVHVAGTNGKGSVCALLERVLRESGHVTGLYTSPHLSDVRERIRVDGRPIPRKAFAAATARALAAERRRPSDRLSYFELATSIAFQHFRDAGVRVAVLETGLGGRFDATNVVAKPLASVVTTIDWDHMDFLGGTLGAIAREKAGIFKRGAPAVVAETKPKPLAVLRRHARRRGAPLREVRPTQWRAVRTEWANSRQIVAGPGGAELELGLLGEAQAANAATALETVRALRAQGMPIPEPALRRGLALARWPGRFEVLRRGRGRAILDGAHNPQAMRVFRRTLEASPWRRTRKLFVVGALRDKEHGELARVLGPALGGHRVAVVRPASPRALEPQRFARELAAAAPTARVRVVPRAADALASWRRDEPVLCVCGSFYLVGEARRLLGADRA